MIILFIWMASKPIKLFTILKIYREVAHVKSYEFKIPFYVRTDFLITHFFSVLNHPVFLKQQNTTSFQIHQYTNLARSYNFLFFFERSLHFSEVVLCLLQIRLRHSCCISFLQYFQRYTQSTPNQMYCLRFPFSLLFSSKEIKLVFKKIVSISARKVVL